MRKKNRVVGTLKQGFIPLSKLKMGAYKSPTKQSYA